MTAPLLLSLAASMDKAANPAELACLEIDIACYNVRVGDYQNAHQIRRKIRAKFGRGEDLKVSIKLIYLDALFLMFEVESFEARDRMERASLLSKMSGDRSLMALTSAWLSNISLNSNDFEQMMREIGICAENLSEATKEAECRMCLVLAGANQLACSQEASGFWYKKVRKFAIDLGDQAAMGALIFNQAAFRLVNFRMDVMRTPLPSSRLTEVRLDVQSAISYQEVANIRSLAHYLQMLQIGLLVLQENYVEAGEELDILIAAKVIRSDSSDFYSLQADRVVILARLGNFPEAEKSAEIIEQRLGSNALADDKAQIANSMLVLAQAKSNIDKSQYWRLIRDSHLREFDALRSDLSSRLSSFTRR